MTSAQMSQALIHTLLSHLEVTIIHVDAGLRILEWSAEPQPLVGLPAPDPPSLSVLDVFPELPGHEQDLLAVSLGRAPRFELPRIDRLGMDGIQHRHLSLIALPHPTERGSLILLVQDVTAQERQLQQVTEELDGLRLLCTRLEAANARLMQLEASRSAVLRVAAHDLRGPLAVAKLYVEFVRDESGLDKDARSFLDIALAQVEEMTRLIDSSLGVEPTDSSLLGQESTPGPKLPARGG